MVYIILLKLYAFFDTNYRLIEISKISAGTVILKVPYNLIM